MENKDSRPKLRLIKGGRRNRESEPKLEKDVLTAEKGLGPEVEIIKEHKDYDGRTHQVGEIANLYTSYTYGVLGSCEQALVFNKRLPFMGTDRSYFKILEKPPPQKDNHL